MDELKAGFKFGETLANVFGKITKPFTNIWDSSLSKSKAALIPLFKALIMIYMMYELGKTYLEGNYKELPIKVVTMSFKFCAIITFFNGGYYFSIPAGVINLVMGSGAPDFNSISPMAKAAELIKGVYAPWDTTGNYVGGIFGELSWWDPLDILPILVVGIFALIIQIFGYLLITIGVFSIVLKAAEMTIGIPVCVLFLAGKALGITDQYFATSMKYIISAIMDFAIILIVVDIGKTMFATLPMTSFLDLVLGLLLCIVYSVLLKIAPKIGSGILNGKPQISTQDTGQILTMGSVAFIAPAALAAGAAGAVGGAVSGAKDGGGLAGAYSGAKSGAGAAAKKSVSGAKGKMNSALS